MVFTDQCILSSIQHAQGSPSHERDPLGKASCWLHPKLFLMSMVFILQARNKLSQLQESHLEAHRSLEQYDQVPDGVSGTSLPDLATLSEGVLLAERGGFGAMVKVE